MTLLAHFVATDAKRLRLATALWIVVSAAEAATIHARPLVAWDPRSAETVAFANMLLWLAGGVLGYAIVSLVLHSHPAVGSDAFWMTRPFPARTLALSKVLMLGALFVGVPVVMELALMAAHAMPATDMVRTALQTTLYRSLFLAGLGVVAVLTPNFARFAIAGAAVLLALAMVPAVVMLIDSWRPARRTGLLMVGLAGNTGLQMPAVGPDPSPLIAAALTAVAAGLAVVFVQYVVRSVWRSILVGAAGFVLAIGVPATGRWGVLRAEVPPPEWARAASSLQLAADPSAVRFDPAPAPDGVTDGRTAHVPIRMTPASPGWIATARVKAATLDAADGPHDARTGGTAGVVLAYERPVRPWDVALQHVLAVSRVALPTYADTNNRGDATVTMRVPGAILERLSGGRADLRAECVVDLTRMEIATTLPFRRGSRFDDGAFRFVVDEARFSGSDLRMHARVTGITTIFDRRPRPLYFYYLRNSARSEAVYGLAHFARHHISYPLLGWTMSYGEPSGFSTNPLVVNFMQRSFGRAEEGQPPPIDVDPAWVEGAELVIVRATHGGSVRRTLEIKGIRLLHSPLLQPR